MKKGVVKPLLFAAFVIAIAMEYTKIIQPR
jgi:hypothetical protein